MSEIRATTISDAAGTGPIALTKQSAAKAWVNFDGTGTIAARDSFNLSSLTDNGTGDYTMSYVSSLANNDYSIGGTSANMGTHLSQIYVPSAADITVGSFKFYTTYASNLTGGGQFVDSSLVGVQIMGDLA